MIVELLIFQMTLEGIMSKANKDIARQRQAESINATKRRMGMLIDGRTFAGRTGDQLSEINSSAGDNTFKPRQTSTRKTRRRMRRADHSIRKTSRVR